jgi:hypothetical protein
MKAAIAALTLAALSLTATASPQANGGAAEHKTEAKKHEKKHKKEKKTAEAKTPTR